MNPNFGRCVPPPSPPPADRDCDLGNFQDCDKTTNTNRKKIYSQPTGNGKSCHQVAQEWIEKFGSVVADLNPRVEDNTVVRDCRN